MPDIDQFTAQLVPNTVVSVTGQYFDLNQPFAMPRYGNTCSHFITGKEYMAAVAKAIRGAVKFIMITDWQLDYDVELDNRGGAKHSGRLSELLAEALQRGVHVRILLYDSIDTGSSLTGTPDTHEESAQSKLESLPAGKGSISVMVQNPNTGNGLFGSDSNSFFSHHQKSIVVDGTVAFLGGLDLAYGRWDTNAFDVIIDRNIHVLNDAYNMQLAYKREPTAAEIKLTQKVGKHPGFHPPYGDMLLDEKTQPRQPWQDIALSIEGPAVFDVFVNFVLRWNSFAGAGTNILDGGMNSGWFERAKGHESLVDPLKKGSGSTNVQICRSASSAQLADELVLWDDRHKYVNDDWKSPNKQRRKIVQEARKNWKSKHQTSIKDAMVNCIRSAQACIYIENQFFISNCGSDSRGTSSPATNPIVAELANAIGRAIHANRPFHVWLVLPEHPEGKMEDAGTNSQTWWALQGVKHAQNSLINRINSTLLKKNAGKWKVPMPPKSNAAVRASLAKHGMENEWRKYLTVLNLRNFGSTDKVVLTEMIYVHSKLLIVDDAVAIIGSANINDRSLNGNGDTELAAVVVDSADSKMTEMGHGVKCITRKFARELRIQLWKKHLGMLVDQQTTGVQKQLLPAGLNLDRPLEASTISAIQRIASANRNAYSQVFRHTPRDSYRNLSTGRLEGYRNTKGELDLTIVPKLQNEYMKEKQTAGAPHRKYLAHDVPKATDYLKAQVKGFWVEMPLNWGVGEAETPPPPGGVPTMIANTEEILEGGVA